MLTSVTQSLLPQPSSPSPTSVASNTSCDLPDGAILVKGTPGYYAMYGGWSICIILAIISTILTVKLVVC